jgi:Na+-driven multidrug efflux pump
VESLMFNGGKLITQVFVVGMGTAVIAANYIAGSVFGLLNIPGAAMSIAATTLVGQHMGRGEAEQAESTMLYLMKAACVCLFVICAAAYPFASLLASAYTQSKDVIQITASLIRTSLITMPTLWALSFIIPSGLKGAGDAKYTLFVSIFGMWAFRITLGYIFGIPLKMGVMGIWLGMYVDWFVRGILFYTRLKRGKWKKNIVIRYTEQDPVD